MTQLTATEVMQASPVMPVIKLDRVEDAVPLAKALMAGGINVMEVTLRTPVALECVEKIAKEVPEVLIGVGTVITPEQLQASVDAGARFALSPGFTPSLLAAAKECPIPFIPGINTVSELMLGRESGLRHFKFFPAASSGGVDTLKGFSALFNDTFFCPTGGINVNNKDSYLDLKSVLCVGGSWVVPGDAVAAGDWQKITDLAKAVTQAA